MDCLERCLRAVRREVPDRVPVVPLIISHAVKQAGVAFSEYNRNPELIASVQACAWRRYGYDGIHITTDNWILPQALGVPVRYHDDLPPVGLDRPLAARRDLALLPPLTEAKTAARMGLLPEATRCARHLFHQDQFRPGAFLACECRARHRSPHDGHGRSAAVCL
jgi:uroporphyrinogen-III decarboxylase